MSDYCIVYCNQHCNCWFNLLSFQFIFFPGNFIEHLNCIHFWAYFFTYTMRASKTSLVRFLAKTKLSNQIRVEIDIWSVVYCNLAAHGIISHKGFYEVQNVASMLVQPWLIFGPALRKRVFHPTIFCWVFKIDLLKGNNNFKAESSHCRSEWLFSILPSVLNVKGWIASLLNPTTQKHQMDLNAGNTWDQRES